IEYYSILLYPEFFADIKPIDKLICNHISGDGSIEHFFTDLHLEYTNKQIGADMATKGILYTLLTYLYRYYPYEVEGARGGPMTAEVLERLERVITYISEHYAEKITTATLAEMCYISEAHFCRFFKNAVGKTVIKYINEYRVEKATVLLLNTGGSVAEIAAEVGFEDPNYFSRVFRSVMGISPAEYRQSAV
ncbi:MAG: helix-turn-helix transcriptional regulator, partial [Clostridia bacterium]|nr:helix-turn-helix transcriptional regulator [Clostridia bacterium]